MFTNMQYCVAEQLSQSIDKALQIRTRGNQRLSTAWGSSLVEGLSRRCRMCTNQGSTKHRYLAE